MDQGTFDDVLADSEPEEWRPVVGYEGLYEVSSLGRIKSLPRNTTRGGLMKLQMRPDGHLQVMLTRNGQQGHRPVHQLVAEAFISARPDGLEVCHNDGNPWNNARTNLRWDTHRSNMLDRVRHGTDPNTLKTHCPKKHEYTPDNTEIRQYPNGPRRFCLKCRKINAKSAYERRRDEGREPAWVPTSELTPEKQARRRDLAAARTRRHRQRKADAAMGRLPC